MSSATRLCGGALPPSLVLLFHCLIRWLPDYKYELEFEHQDDVRYSSEALREQKAKYQLSLIMMDNTKV